MRSRHGFTLLEILVALVILSGGILGLAANAALVSRLVGDGSRLTVAATLAISRFEELRALPCARIAPGTGVTRGIEERWTAAPLGPGAEPRALEVHIAVTYPSRGAGSGSSRMTQRFTGAIPCR